MEIEIENPEIPQDQVDVPAVDDKPVDQADPATEGTPQEGDVPQYTPNLSYKVSGKEKTFPEYLKSVITDEKIEKELRDVFTRADGLPFIRERSEQIMQEATQLRDQNSQYQNFFQESRHLRDIGDFESFFKMNGINRSQVEDWLRNQYELEERGPNAIREYQSSLDARRQAFSRQRENASLQDRYAQLERSNMDMAIRLATINPDYQDVRVAMNEGIGPGAFEGAVRAAIQNGLSPDEAVEQAASGFRQTKFYSLWSGQSQTQSMQTPAQPAMNRPNPPQGVLPNLGRGSAGSPVRRKIESIADMRKLAAEMD